MITTRRIKMEPVPAFPEMNRWVSTTFDPFNDVFDETICDTMPIKVHMEEEPIDHRPSKGTYRDLGGFYFEIPMNQTTENFLKRLEFLRDPANGFMAPNTVSVIANMVFYNEATASFIISAL